MTTTPMRIFALEASRGFGERMAGHLGRVLDMLRERGFEDGEHKSRPLVSVRGHDVFVVQSLYGDAEQSVNDKLARLLFFIGALKENGANCVTAVVPYLAYARKDRQTQPLDPVTTKYMARLFEAVGTDRIMTIDVHNLAAYQNAFRCESVHLEARELFAGHFIATIGTSRLAVVSPDIGGVKRADALRATLADRTGEQPGAAFIEKYRALGKVRGGTVVGDVAGCDVIIVDDLISTGGTIARAAQACRDKGAASVHVAVTHGLFIPPAAEVLADPSIDSVVIADTVPPFRLPEELVRRKVVQLDAASLFGDAVARMHRGHNADEQ